MRRRVVVTDEQRLIIALWIVHTYLAHVLEQTPYLAITSPQKRCGKSQLPRLMDRLVAHPWSALLPSEATAYRKIDAEKPTWLLDEVDAIFALKTAQYHEGLRAIINAGNVRGTTIDRCANFGNTLVAFDPYCAKALAGNGVMRRRLSTARSRCGCSASSGRSRWHASVAGTRRRRGRRSAKHCSGGPMRTLR
jgi:hypothetical protein